MAYFICNITSGFAIVSFNQNPLTAFVKNKIKSITPMVDYVLEFFNEPSPILHSIA